MGKNLEVYVDDMVVKSRNTISHAEDLTEVLTEIRKYNMRLNSKKCKFKVQGRKFLGFMLTHRGIESNPDKCATIIAMRSLNTLKKV